MLFFSPRGVLDEILNLIESVSEGYLPTFDVCDKLWVLIRSVPEVSLLIQFLYVYVSLKFYALVASFWKEFIKMKITGLSLRN